MNPLRLFLCSSACLLALAGQAQVRARPGQPAPTGKRLSQLDNARIAFITARVVLTQDQAQRFWPVYTEFITKRRDLNRSTRLLRRAIDNPSLSDAQLLENFNQDFAIRQQQLTLEKDYFERVQRVLSLRQVAQFYQAERDFTKEVLRRVADPKQADALPSPR